MIQQSCLRLLAERDIAKPPTATDSPLDAGRSCGEGARVGRKKNSAASGKVLGDLPHTRDPQSAILSPTVILASQAKRSYSWNRASISGGCFRAWPTIPKSGFQESRDVSVARDVNYGAAPAHPLQDNQPLFLRIIGIPASMIWKNAPLEHRTVVCCTTGTALGLAQCTPFYLCCAAVMVLHACQDLRRMLGPGQERDKLSPQDNGRLRVLCRILLRRSGTPTNSHTDHSIRVGNFAIWTKVNTILL